ncbi:hypothetical protein K439DRAFT_1339637 [Ramaria rubella]|nr:hypothetical protein K439DRAFT_1339637 [Ramaria rubella]
MIVDSINPAVQHAILILDQLIDLGKVLPFISPAFIILKIIIDIEQRAKDADAKCNDLLERITFMLGHLPILKHVQVMDATRQVVENMNGALKTAASLIQAYRKQGFIARRLNIGYRDKFASCAEAIASSCNNLMMSLQIHQTGQLDILTRSIPVDPEDEAAQIFLDQHGGQAVKSDPALVTQFAQKLHLSMDDKVMEQMNANLTSVMQQNQVQFEETINGNVSAAVANGLKGLATQMNDAEKEQVYYCIQCEKEFRNSTNGPTSCTFHTSRYKSCCETLYPCQRAHNIFSYRGNIFKWLALEDTNLENNKTQQASVGRLYKWFHEGPQINEPTIFIRVGALVLSEPYFMDTFTSTSLEEISRSIGLTCSTTIFRTSLCESEFALAEWVISPEGIITGVSLTVKAATSETPFVQVCPLDAATCTQSGDIVIISKGGFYSYTAAAPYTIPETIRVGPTLRENPLRPARTDFKTCTSPNLPVILKTISEPPLTANINKLFYDADNFEGVVSIFNKHSISSSNPITISSVSASFRLVGDQDYTPVSFMEVLDGTYLPVTIDPRQSWRMAFQVNVPHSKQDTQSDGFRRCAFVARNRPLRLKLTFRDMEEGEASIVLEYVFAYPFSLKVMEKDDLAFFYTDDPDLWKRRCLRFQRHTWSRSEVVISIENNDLNIITLQRIVYKAIKSGDTEVALDMFPYRDHKGWVCAAWALVDVSCRRVYAFKVLIKKGRKYGCLGYVLCPEYGEIKNESRPVRYAIEKVKPDFEPFIAPEFPTDDAIDDLIPELAKPTAGIISASPSTSTSSQLIISPEVDKRLASIDSSLGRIDSTLSRIDSSLLQLATAAQQLADIFAKTKTSSS